MSSCAPVSAAPHDGFDRVRDPFAILLLDRVEQLVSRRQRHLAIVVVAAHVVGRVVLLVVTFVSPVVALAAFMKLAERDHETRQ
jgi:hypothetical protein